MAYLVAGLLFSLMAQTLQHDGKWNVQIQYVEILFFLKKKQDGKITNDTEITETSRLQMTTAQENLIKYI